MWPYLFAGLIILVIILKYLKIGANRCPQCNAQRDEELPLCEECGWIFDSAEDDVDGDYEYGEPEIPDEDSQQDTWDSQDWRR